MRLKNLTERSLAVLLIAGAAIFLARTRLFLSHGMIPPDFEAYLQQWEHARHGHSPYALDSAWNHSPGVLALARFLPRDPVAAWQVYGGLSIALLAGALFLGVRYRSFGSVARLALGLLLGWSGCDQALDRGQSELLVLGLATIAASSFEVAPAVSGLLLGFLPGFGLSWVFLCVPFALAARMDHRRRAHRFRRFLSGYLGGWLIWASALPSLTFGREPALKLSEAWVAAIRSQPAWIWDSPLNQSVWATAQRFGLAPLAALGLAGVLAGFVLGRLVVRSQETASGRIHRWQGLAWMSPWLLYVQWISPVAWPWASVFAVGMPLAWSASGPRLLRWTCMAWILFLWALQQSGLEGLGSSGITSFCWCLMLCLV